MEFTERHHAFISATFYRLLREGNFPNYEAAFCFAARRYAEQRGERMAQRAIRDGRPLDFSAYQYYGEWQPTPASKAAGFRTPEHFSSWQEGGDIYLKYGVCPWSTQYLSMGLREGANLYCSDLDAAIVRGFNPKLHYEVRQTMHDKEDFCLQVMCGGACGEGYGPQAPENIRDFTYHCGHVFKTFSEVMAAIYRADGIRLSGQVMEAFQQEYGKELADTLAAQLDRNYNYID